MVLQLAFVLLAIVIGARIGGIGLGVLGGLGLAILTFFFGLEPTAPPIDVMLMIVAVIAAASCMQAGARHQDPPGTSDGDSGYRFPAGHNSQSYICGYGRPIEYAFRIWHYVDRYINGVGALHIDRGTGRRVLFAPGRKRIGG